MFFDKLCGIAERGHLPANVRATIAKAMVFQFPGRAHEVLPNSGKEGGLISNVGSDDFFLPFPEMVIEDTASCVVLADLTQDAQGWSAKRLVVEAMPVSVDNTAEFDTVLMQIDPAVRAKLPRDTYMVCWAVIAGIDFDPDSTMFYAQVDTGGLYFGTKHEPLVEPSSRNWSLLLSGQTKVLVQNAIVAMKEVAFFNTPDRYVLESSTVGGRGPKPGMIPRADQRPIYQLLTRKEIRSRFGLPEGNGNGHHPCPHRRKAHKRTYRHERFAKSGLQGRTVRVRNAWVGPSEAQVGNKIYKVRLDL